MTSQESTGYLDPRRSSSTLRRMNVDEALRTQNWSHITAQLTVFAWKRTHKRSWELAHDLAQDAIVQAFEHKAGWNPDQEPIALYLGRLVINLAHKELRKKRHAVDVAMSAAAENVALPGDSLETTIARRHFTEAVYQLLAKAVEKDRVASMLLTLMVEDVDTPRDQAAATGEPIEEIRRARRRLFDHAERIARELGEVTPTAQSERASQQQEEEVP